MISYLDYALQKVEDNAFRFSECEIYSLGNCETLKKVCDIYETLKKVCYCYILSIYESNIEIVQSVSMNNEMTSISISGMTLASVENMLHRVGYVNTRMFPTPGHRPVTMETHAT